MFYNNMIRFTTREIRDILISMLVIAFIFAYLFSGNQIPSLGMVIITLIAVGLGFVLHELAHKFMAMKYGFWAEYRLWVQGLILAVITAMFGIVFAAPGAVYIHGQYISREQNGKISLAGPATNIILAGIFFLLMHYVPALYALGVLGFTVNSFIALFNLIPFSILDGAKIIKWNPIIWVAVTALAGLMVFYAFSGRFLY